MGELYLTNNIEPINELLEILIKILGYTDTFTFLVHNVFQILPYYLTK